MNELIEIGTVHALYRHPVKSMRSERLTEGHLYWHGLDGDRRFAFVRGDVTSSFPWLTGRQIPQITQYRPFFVDPDDFINSQIRVETPDGHILSLDSPELHQELMAAYQGPVSLINIGRGTFDSQPFSLMSLATADALSATLGHTIDYRCFRQNLILETQENRPFLEESWLDSQLIIGDGANPCRIRLNRRIQRCIMVTIDPDTAQKEPEILKIIAQTRGNCVGVYASIEIPGLIRTGDPVYWRHTL